MICIYATIKIANIKENNIKLDYLVSVAGNLESLGYDLKDFVAYFDKLFESGIDIKYSKEKDSRKCCKYYEYSFI